MPNSTGFWSYVHKDDDAEGRRITRLAADLTRQYELITGESISIFVDRNDIEWGDEWETVVDTSLASIAFFIPILTPRYFRSEECRREFNSFARRATRLGVKELVMPILYINFPALEADPPPDELMALAKTFQWENWTELRFESTDSPRYRAAVAKMAERLSRAAYAVEQIDVATESEVSAEQFEEDEDAPGFSDQVLRAEQALAAWSTTLTDVHGNIEEIAKIVTAAGQKIQDSDSQGRGMAGRVAVFRDLATELEPHADSIQDLSNSFTTQMNDIDLGIRAIFKQAESEIHPGGSKPEEEAQLDEFFGILRNLSASADDGLGSLQLMIDSISAVENQSRNLRPVFRKLGRGLSVLLDGRSVIRGWVSLADDLETRISGD